MKTAIPIDKYLAVNQGRYLRETFELPQCNSSLYVTTHFEAADTSLPHYHDSAHLSFILNGGVFDKRKGTENERLAGDLMFFRAGEVHQSIYRQFPSRNINIELDLSFFEQNSISESYFENGAVKSGRAKFTMLKAYREMLCGDRFSDASIEMLLLDLTEEYRDNESRPQWLCRAIELLHDRWNDDLSVIEIAAATGVHPKTVSKHFSRHIGCTLGEYRRRLKVERSLSLIRGSNRPLTEIAQTCGFFDQSHFISVFKGLTGMRPSQFRRL
jgi:AraC family transcriptional regulator